MSTEKCAPSEPAQYEWVPYPSEGALSTRNDAGRRWKLLRNGEMVGRVVKPFWQTHWDAHGYGGWYSPAHPTMHAAARELFQYIVSGDSHCHSGRDGECNWQQCPQLRDKEPATTGRHCPYDRNREDD